jgi:hypothetical protein
MEYVFFTFLILTYLNSSAQFIRCYQRTSKSYSSHLVLTEDGNKFTHRIVSTNHLWSNSFVTGTYSQANDTIIMIVKEFSIFNYSLVQQTEYLERKAIFKRRSLLLIDNQGNVYERLKYRKCNEK